MHFQPINVCFGNDLDIEDLISHHAFWHKSCHLKYSGSRLTRTKKRKTDHNEESGRMPTKRQALNINNCMFCEMESEEGDPLHQVLTFDADANIRDMVTELQDTKLLAQIGTEDLIAKEAKYHLKCLVKVRNRYRSYQRKNEEQQQATINEKNG